jgi:hypothetical protein
VKGVGRVQKVRADRTFNVIEVPGYRQTFERKEFEVEEGVK